MALQVRARFKSDSFRSSLESLVTGLNTSVTPPTAVVVIPAQIVVYDDVAVTAANYRPGDPTIEQFITVVYEDSLSFQLEGFAGMTAAQITTEFNTRLDAWSLSVKPALLPLAQVMYAARRLNPRVIP